VLAGGASYGAVQVGQLRALARTDLVPDMVVGTSVGSLNGAVLAENPEMAADRLAALWSTVSRDQIFGKNLDAAYRVVSRQSAAFDNASLRAFVEVATTARDFADLAIPLTAVATDFDTGEVVPIREGDLMSAVLASAAIPAVFPIVEREGKRLVDGGVVANVPISIAAAQGAKTLVILDCGFTVVAPQKDDTLVSNILRTAAIMASLQVRRDLEAITDQTVLYLPGPWPIGSRPDDFKRSQELATGAYDLSLEWLAQLRVDGPGRYGAAPSDSLSRPVERPPAS
jgi:NTE family protein